MKKPTALIILDGFGLSEHVEGNAVKAARTPTVDGLNASAPRSVLSASGGSVGLMDGQMGDSNVGHPEYWRRAHCLPRRGTHFQGNCRWRLFYQPHPRSQHGAC